MTDSSLCQPQVPRNVSDIPAEPWRNGGGMTRTLATADEQWRISLAQIEADGPYSRFPGLTRRSAVLRGAGLVLRDLQTEPHMRIDLLPLGIGGDAEYDGAVVWDARLHDGPVTALNVMSANGRFRTTIRVIDRPMECTVRGTAFVITLDQAVDVLAHAKAAIADRMRDEPHANIGTGRALPIRVAAGQCLLIANDEPAGDAGTIGSVGADTDNNAGATHTDVTGHIASTIWHLSPLPGFPADAMHNLPSPPVLVTIEPIPTGMDTGAL